MKTSATPDLEDLDQYVHLYGDELREADVKHYFQKFLCQGELASDSLAEVTTWIAGTGGATMRAEKMAVLKQIRESRVLR